MNNSLPIISTFLEAISFPYRFHRLLLKVGLPAIVAGGGYAVYNHIFFDRAGTSELESYQPWVNIFVNPTAFNFASLVIFIVFCMALAMSIVGCHRLLLLGESSVNKSNLLNWTGNEIKYMLRWFEISLRILVIVILVFIFPLVIMMIIKDYFDLEVAEPRFLDSEAVISIMCLPFLYIAARWSLVLPSAAIDNHRKGFSWSWKISTGNGWRLTLLISLIPFITSSLFELLPTFDSLFFTLLHGALWLLVGAVEVALLSLSYKHLVENENIKIEPL